MTRQHACAKALLWLQLQSHAAKLLTALCSRHSCCRTHTHTLRVQDDAALASGGSGMERHAWLCAQLRAGERAALTHTINFYMTDNTALERKEYYQVRRCSNLGTALPGWEAAMRLVWHLDHNTARLTCVYECLDVFIQC
jgi:hypothetical protein